MVCREIIEKTTDYFEAALSDPARREWESHLTACIHCARYVIQYRTTIRLLRLYATVSRSGNS